MQISINNNSYFAKGYNHYDTLYTNNQINRVYYEQIYNNLIFLNYYLNYLIKI